MSRKQEVCRDFQRGSCRFGSRCKYLHTAPQQPQQQRGFGFNQPQQPQRGGFSTTSAFNQPQQSSGFFSPPNLTQQQQQNKAGLLKDHKCIDVRLCKEQIREDLSNERPSFWRLTSYAHWKYLPNDVNGDVSFEELRAHAYQSATQGMSIQQVAQREALQFSSKNSEFESLVKNYRGPAPAPNSGSVSPFLVSSASASPFLSPPATGPMLFPTPSPPAASGFAQPFQQVAAPSPFQSAGAFQPSTGFMSPFRVQSSVGSGGDFQASNPFAGPQNAGGVSWPSFPSNSFNNPPAAGPVNNPFGSFPLAYNSPSSTSPIPSPFTGSPGATSSQTSFSFFPNSGATTSASTSSPAIVQAGEKNIEDKWSVSRWSIGEIPEDEPPVHVR